MVCPVCGAVLQDGQKFCHICGYHVAADAHQASADEVVGEPSAQPQESPETQETLADDGQDVVDGAFGSDGAFDDGGFVTELDDEFEDEPKVWGFSQSNDEWRDKQMGVAQPTMTRMAPVQSSEPSEPEPRPGTTPETEEGPETGEMPIVAVLASHAGADGASSQPEMAFPDTWGGEPATEDTTSVLPTSAEPQVEPTMLMPQPVNVDTQQLSGLPQPVSSQMPLSGSSTPVAPSGFGAASQASSPYQQIPPAASQSVPLTPQVVEPPKPRRGLSTGMKVAAAALAAFIIIRAGFALFGLFGRDTSKPVDSGITEVEVQNDRPTSIVPDSGSDTSSNTKPESGPQATPVSNVSASDYLQNLGYPTLLAFMDLTGQQINDLVTENDYTFYEEEDSAVYAKYDGTIVFNAITANGSSDQQTFNSLGRGGIGEPVIYVMVLEGYSSVDDVLDGVANCSVTMRKQVGGEGKELVALVHGPTMREYLVNVYDVEDGDYEVDLYNPEAISAGFFDVVNDGSYGSTTGDVFKNYER